MAEVGDRKGMVHLVLHAVLRDFIAVVFAFWAFCGLCAVVMGVIQQSQEHAKLADAKTTPGRVIRLESNMEGGPASIAFKTETGAEIVFRIEDGWNYDEGEEVTVAYNPSRPQAAAVYHRGGGLIIALGVVVFLFCGAICALLVWRALKSRRM